MKSKAVNQTSESIYDLQYFRQSLCGKSALHELYSFNEDNDPTGYTRGTVKIYEARAEVIDGLVVYPILFTSGGVLNLDENQLTNLLLYGEITWREYPHCSPYRDSEFHHLRLI